jgi:hypothetical protein
MDLQEFIQELKKLQRYNDYIAVDGNLYEERNPKGEYVKWRDIQNLIKDVSKT